MANKNKAKSINDIAKWRVDMLRLQYPNLTDDELVAKHNEGYSMPEEDAKRITEYEAARDKHLEEGKKNPKPLVTNNTEHFRKVVEQAEAQMAGRAMAEQTKRFAKDYKTAVNEQVLQAKYKAYDYKLMAKSLWEAAKLTTATYGAANSLKFIRTGNQLPMATTSEYAGMGMDVLETPSSIIDIERNKTVAPFAENDAQIGLGYAAANQQRDYEFKLRDANNRIKITELKDIARRRWGPGVLGLAGNLWQIGSSIKNISDGVTNNEQKAMGGKSVIKPNIIRGGQAIPLGNNFYYMQGRKHSAGGIDIGKDLEVEGGEVMKMGKKDVKVYSSVPFLGGKSPAERVMNGENADDVFNAQQRFKKVNRINDDGTKKAFMGKDIPYTQQNLLSAAVANPNGGIFIGNASIPKEQREYTVDLPDVVVTAKRNQVTKQYGITPEDMAEYNQKLLERSRAKSAKTRTKYDDYMDAHPLEKDLFGKIGAVPEMDVKGNVTWRYPTREYSDRVKNYPNHNHLHDGVLKYVRDDLKLGNSQDANKPSTLRDRWSDSDWYYVQCAQAANEINRKLGLPTTGNAWTRRGLYGDDLIFDNSDLKYNYAEDRKINRMTPSKRRLLNRNLQDGDYVDMIYKYSTSKEKAKSGRGNTHTGNIITDSTGRPYVIDNFGGSLKIRTLDEVLNGGEGAISAARIYRARKYTNPAENAILKGYQGNSPVRRMSRAEQYVPTSYAELNDKKQYKFGGKYNTKLSDKEEQEFQQWYKRVAKFKKLNANPDADGQDYDYRGYWKNTNPYEREMMTYSNEGAHFTDRYKQPNHPTFSNESKYANDNTGGTWNGNVFVPSIRQTKDTNRRRRYLNNTGEGFFNGSYDEFPTSNKKYKNGGMIYNLTTNKGGSLGYVPSTGGRHKADWGTIVNAGKRRLSRSAGLEPKDDTKVQVVGLDGKTRTMSYAQAKRATASANISTYKGNTINLGGIHLNYNPATDKYEMSNLNTGIAPSGALAKGATSVKDVITKGKKVVEGVKNIGQTIKNAVSSSKQAVNTGQQAVNTGQQVITHTRTANIPRMVRGSRANAAQQAWNEAREQGVRAARNRRPSATEVLHGEGSRVKQGYETQVATPRTSRLQDVQARQEAANAERLANRTIGERARGVKASALRTKRRIRDWGNKTNNRANNIFNSPNEEGIREFGTIRNKDVVAGTLFNVGIAGAGTGLLTYLNNMNNSSANNTNMAAQMPTAENKKQPVKQQDTKTTQTKQDATQTKQDTTTVKKDTTTIKPFVDNKIEGANVAPEVTITPKKTQQTPTNGAAAKEALETRQAKSKQRVSRRNVVKATPNSRPTQVHENGAVAPIKLDMKLSDLGKIDLAGDIKDKVNSSPVLSVNPRIEKQMFKPLTKEELNYDDRQITKYGGRQKAVVGKQKKLTAAERKVIEDAKKSAALKSFIKENNSAPTPFTVSSTTLNGHNQQDTPIIDRTKFNRDLDDALWNKGKYTKIDRSGDSANGLFKNNTTNDWLSAGLNLAGSVGSALINNSMLNKMKYSEQPMGKIANKLKTKINVNPQIDAVNNSEATAFRNIDSNTGSSRVALARKQGVRLNSLASKNSIYANKENQETTLINQDRLNQQQVQNANIDSYNEWAKGKTAFDNAVAEKRAENWNSLIGNINLAGQDLLTRPEKREAEYNNTLAMALANPNLPIELFKDIVGNRGVNGYRRAYSLNR